ncbi:MAG: ABC transporter permease [Nitrososphaerota archaeon]
MVELSWIEGVLALTVQFGTVYLLASLGEIYAERSGILNLGMEGMMIVGAAIAFVFTNALGHLLSLVSVVLIGALMGLLLAFLVVTLRLNQVVVGLALTLFGYGLSGLLTQPAIRARIMRALNPEVPEVRIVTQQAEALRAVKVPVLSEIPVVGPVLFSQNALVYFALIAAVVMWFVLFRTSIGLAIRSVGENPSMADSLGINVFRIRYVTSVIAGVMGALAGAYLFIGYQPFWVEMMTNGRGFIALALVILASWSPIRAVFGSLLFGGVEVIQFRLQLFGFAAQTPQFVLMLPYVVAIVTLTVLSVESVRKRLGVPEALGKPYYRE